MTFWSNTISTEIMQTHSLLEGPGCSVGLEWGRLVTSELGEWVCCVGLEGARLVVTEFGNQVCCGLTTITSAWLVTSLCAGDGLLTSIETNIEEYYEEHYVSYLDACHCTLFYHLLSKWNKKGVCDAVKWLWAWLFWMERKVKKTLEGFWRRAERVFAFLW